MWMRAIKTVKDSAACCGTSVEKSLFRAGAEMLLGRGASLSREYQSPTSAIWNRRLSSLVGKLSRRRR